MGFSKQGYWSELPLPPPGYLPDPGIEPESPASPALADGFFTSEPWGFPLQIWGSEKSFVSLLLNLTYLDKLSANFPPLSFIYLDKNIVFQNDNRVVWNLTMFEQLL